MPPRRRRVAIPGTPKPPVVASNTKNPQNPKLKPGAPGGPPKSAGQLAFEAREREDKRLGRGRWAPGGPLAGQVNPKLKPGAPGGPPKSAGQLAFEAKEREDAKHKRGRFSPMYPHVQAATESVRAANLPALNELQRMMEEMATRGERDISQTQQRGAREKANLEELYARLGNFQGQVQGTQQQNYQTLIGQAGTAYDQLERNLNQTYDGAQAKAVAEAQRLGLGNVTGIGEAYARGQSDQDYNVGRAQADRAALQGGFAQQSQGFDQLMALTRANTGTESASRQAVSMRETNASVDELQFELEQRLRDLEGRTLDIRSTEGAKIQELARSLEEAKYAREQEAKQQAFQNMIAQENLNLSKSGQQFNQQQSLAELAQRQAEAAAAASAGPSESEILDVALKQQKLDAAYAASQAAVGGQYRDRLGIPDKYRGTPNSRNPRSPRSMDRMRGY